MAPKKTLLVIDDEADLLTLLTTRLKHTGYDVVTAATAAEGISAAREFKPHLILLDVTLPDGDGFDVCKTLKKTAATRRIPVIMLTARGTATDEVLGLELGADDYVTKPYDFRVLESRIKNLLQRQTAASAESGPEITDERIDAGRLLIDLRARQVFVDRAESVLTPLEYRILVTLAVKAGRVFTREELIEITWKHHKDLTRAVKVNNHINNLRKKLGACADCIETLHGSGYRFKTV